jgi:hypothetical protein
VVVKDGKPSQRALNSFSGGILVLQMQEELLFMDKIVKEEENFPLLQGLIVQITEIILLCLDMAAHLKKALVITL